MPTWEYRTARVRQWLLADEKFQQETAEQLATMNVLGAEGWEVISAHPLPSMQYIDFVLWLKRPGKGS